jgi:hypothetical protein
VTVHLLVIINISKRQGCHVATCIQQNSSAEHFIRTAEDPYFGFCCHVGCRD